MRPRDRSSVVSRALAGAAAAFAVVGLAAGTAQQRVPTQGDALDANNRIGSGGSNRGDASPVNQRYRQGNNVVTGNVTGGRGFRDFVPYGAPTDFQDLTGGRGTSAFAGESAGVTGGGRLINNAQVVRPYYGNAQTTRVPAGYERVPATGGYLPPGSVAPVDTRLDGRIDAYHLGGATRIDSRARLNLNDPAVSGAANAAGGAAGQGAPSSVPSALLGEGGVAGPRALSPYTQLARDSRLAAFTPDRIGQLRIELLRDPEGNRLAPEELDVRVSQQLARQLESAVAPASAQRPGESARPLDSAAAGGMARQTPFNPDEPRQDPDLRLADPAEQSAQYAQLLERLRRFEKDPYAEALRPLMPQRAEPAEGEEPPLPGLPSILPPADAAPGAQRPGSPADPPVEVRSLAAGVASPTLKQVYEQAERMMVEGKFTSAIARYDAAEQLVPNQPLTLLGRATAELGAGYFRRSALSLRRALGEHRELMMAQVDLAGLLGRERLTDLAETLRQRAAAEREDADPVFLLAFIAYNSGQYEQADAFLELAQRRSGDDPFFAELRKHWALAPPEGGAQPAVEADATTRPVEDPQK